MILLNATAEGHGGQKKNRAKKLGQDWKGLAVFSGPLHRPPLPYIILYKIGDQVLERGRILRLRFTTF